MKAVWFIGCRTNEQREDRRKEVASYKTAFDALREVLQNNFHKKEAVYDYGSPGWEHRQIAVNEYNRALEDITSLLDVQQEKLKP